MAAVESLGDELLAGAASGTDDQEFHREACCLTALRISCGRNPRGSEFYGPLSATGGLLAAQHRPAVSPAPRLPFGPLKHQILALNPARPRRQVFGAGKPQCFPARAHEHESRLRIAGPRLAPSVVREAMRLAAAQRVAVLEAIADDPKVAPGDRIRAVDTLAKYGLGQMVQVGMDDVRGRLRATLELLRETLAEDEFTTLVHKLKEIWT
jgi:hypothetical protein